VYFAHIESGNNGLLGRTAEYLSAGYFHNSLITGVNHRNKTLTFRFKKHVDRASKEKTYAEMTMPIFEFMAKMLCFLPDKHGREIWWYGMYANGVREKLQKKTKAAWASAIMNSVRKDPEICPRCAAAMTARTVFSFFALAESKRLWRTLVCVQGIFYTVQK
jgi:hypothetical protein